MERSSIQNEITNIPELLSYLDIRESTITADALNTQTSVMQQIIEQGGHFVMMVKRNQPGSYEEIVSQFGAIKSERERMKKDSSYQTVYPEYMKKYEEVAYAEKNRDRYEYREYRVINDASFVSRTSKQWPFLKSVHKDFGKLLADMEIYVNGIAAMQIQNLNAWVDVARSELMEKYSPDESDSTAYLLNAAHIHEGEYFSHRVYEDLRAIMEDIREAHKSRTESADESIVADELKRDLEEATNFKGSRLEQLVFLFCKQTKIRYNKLTEEEKKWLIRISMKSELAQGGPSQRGRKR